MAAKTGKKAKATKAPTKNNTKSAYLRNDSPELQRVVRGVRSLVKAAVPGAKITVNSWGIPTFETEQPFCFYMVGKNHVTFGFHNGTSLADPESLLEGTGKNVRHVKLKSTEDLRKKGLKDLVLAAERLEWKSPMKGMSGQGK
jgi:hypothetical protein